MDNKGFTPLFKTVWIGSTAILFIVAFYLIYKHESSTGLAVGRYSGIGYQRTITGPGVLIFAILFLLTALLLFGFRRKRHKSKQS